MTTTPITPSTPPVATRKPRTGAATTALVLSIIALAGSPLPILNNMTIIAGFIAIPFAIVALFGIKRGTAITSLVMAIAGVTIGLALQAQWGAELDRIGDEMESSFNQIPTMPPMAP